MIPLLIKAFTGNKDSQYGLLAGLAKRWGYRLQHPHLNWHADGGLLSLVGEFPGTAGLTPKRYNLYHFARAAAHLPGDTAECGVATGITSYLIWHAARKPHHAFDSFKGLPAPDPIDMPHSEGIAPLAMGDYAFGLDEVKMNLAACDGVAFYKGWIPERFSDLPDAEFCFVHIDVDFYEPTQDSFACFYPRMVPGGMMLCDDYGFKGTPGAALAVDDFFAGKPEHIVKLASGQALIIKQ